jgi:hypothetical protein
VQSNTNNNNNSQVNSNQGSQLGVMGGGGLKMSVAQTKTTAPVGGGGKSNLMADLDELEEIS